MKRIKVFAGFKVAVGTLSMNDSELQAYTMLSYSSASQLIYIYISMHIFEKLFLRPT